MTATWFGDRAVRFALPRRADRARAVTAFRAEFPECSVRAGLEAVIIEAREPDPGLLDRVLGVRIAPADIDEMALGRSVSIAVRYDGSDLAEVAELLRVSRTRLIDAHQEQVWEVAMMGFAPGFGYLVPAGDRRLDWAAVPRRAAPRPRVPDGSVAVAAGMSAVYPHAMPGGWQLLGSTTVTLFDPERTDDPTVLHPGDAVRFVADG